MKMTLDKMRVDHPYYCCGSNFYSYEPNYTWETATDFLNEFEESDIDMNLVFRWDINEEDVGRYSADVFIMAQRNGIYTPQHIRSINEQEIDRFARYLKKHWHRLNELWAPLSSKGGGDE